MVLGWEDLNFMFRTLGKVKEILYWNVRRYVGGLVQDVVGFVDFGGKRLPVD